MCIFMCKIWSVRIERFFAPSSKKMSASSLGSHHVFVSELSFLLYPSFCGSKIILLPSQLREWRREQLPGPLGFGTTVLDSCFLITFIVRKCERNDEGLSN